MHDDINGDLNREVFVKYFSVFVIAAPFHLSHEYRSYADLLPKPLLISKFTATSVVMLIFQCLPSVMLPPVGTGPTGSYSLISIEKDISVLKDLSPGGSTSGVGP